MKPDFCPRADEAALFCLGVLPPLEARAFEAHVEGGCTDCERRLSAAEDTVARVDLLVDGRPDAPTSAGEALRERLLHRIRSTPGACASEQACAPGEGDWSLVAEGRVARPWRAWVAEDVASVPGLQTVARRDDPAAWQATRFDGVRVQPLSVDEERRFVTMLVQMDPGASYPPHRHAGREECFVLEGDLLVQRPDEESLTMGRGDYQVADEGSVHGVQSTQDGCLLLIVSSQDDVLLA